MHNMQFRLSDDHCPFYERYSDISDAFIAARLRVELPCFPRYPPGSLRTVFFSSPGDRIAPRFAKLSGRFWPACAIREGQQRVHC